MEYHDILIKSSELRTTNKWFKTIEKILDRMHILLYNQLRSVEQADVAQLVEQLTCNQ